MVNTHLISIAKAISWRIFGTIATILLAKFVTGNWDFAVKIGMLELVSKIFLFYVHDQLWERFTHKKTS